MKKFLVVGAGELQTGLILAAKNMGLKVYASDKNPEAPGFTYADESIIADTMNPQETLDALLQKTDSLDGVATAGTDASAAVALIAEHFSLPGHSRESVLAATDKIIMRQKLEKAGVSIPRYKAISSLAEAEGFFDIVFIGFPPRDPDIKVSKIVLT